MKNHPFQSLAIFTVAGSLVASCSLIKDINYTVTPSPLEMHADSVRVRVELTFPQKGLRKKASVEVTPMLGNTAFKPVLIMGEKATGNGTTVRYKPGGFVNYEDVIAYTPEMENAELTVSGRVMKGGVQKMVTPIKKIADGTIITPYLVNKDFKVVSEKDKHINVREDIYTAQVTYLRAKSDLQNGELDKASLKSFAKWLSDAQNNPKITIKSIQVVGYASPEGEENSNNTLSTDRANTGKTTTLYLAKNAKNVAASKEIYTLLGRGEDYEGFKKELEKSSMDQDEKQLVIRVLEMYKDPIQRETEMRNMAKTFTYLDEKIFPKLRRAEIKVTYETSGYSDEEYLSLAKTTPEKLGVEELLYAASLESDVANKFSIYAACEKLFPSDHRAYNNAGVLLFTQGKLADATSKFEKALTLNQSGLLLNNLAAVAGAKGDFKKAKEWLSKASGPGKEGDYNNGIISIVEGNYASAIASLGNDKTFNKALAQVLNKDFEKAIATIDDSPDASSAQGHYLKAIALARQDKVDACIQALQASIAKDASYKVKMVKDREFLKFAANENFVAISK